MIAYPYSTSLLLFTMNAVRKYSPHINKQTAVDGIPRIDWLGNGCAVSVVTIPENVMMIDTASIMILDGFLFKKTQPLLYV